MNMNSNVFSKPFFKWGAAIAGAVIAGVIVNAFSKPVTMKESIIPPVTFSVVESDLVFSEKTNPSIKAQDNTLLAYIIDVPGQGGNAQIKVDGEKYLFLENDLPITFKSEDKNYLITLKVIKYDETKEVVVDILSSKPK